MSKADETDDTGPGRIVFKIVGPLKRSTLEREHPDPEWERLSDARWWSFCTRLQAGRLRESLVSELSMGQKRYTFASRLFATTSFDEHFFFVAAGNLARAAQRLRGKDLVGAQPPEETRRVLRLLRNIYEHWDELKAGYRHETLRGAAAKLAKEYPDAEPWSLALEPDGDIIVANAVGLRSLCRDLRDFEAKLWWRLRALRREGRHQPSETPPNQANAADNARR